MVEIYLGTSSVVPEVQVRLPLFFSLLTPCVVPPAFLPLLLDIAARAVQGVGQRRAGAAGQRESAAGLAQGRQRLRLPIGSRALQLGEAAEQRTVAWGG